MLFPFLSWQDSSLVVLQKSLNHKLLNVVTLLIPQREWKRYVVHVHNYAGLEPGDELVDLDGDVTPYHAETGDGVVLASHNVRRVDEEEVATLERGEG